MRGRGGKVRVMHRVGVGVGINYKLQTSKV